jgi:glutamate transport system ATP-binding protein
MPLIRHIVTEDPDGSGFPQQRTTQGGPTVPDGVQRADGAGSLISLRGVSRRYGLVQVLNRIDLELGGGQVTALLGPVGAGKSTLCRAVSGSERIDSGSITVAGEPLLRRHRRFARTYGDGRGVGPVAEPDSLLAHRTVLQNVALGHSFGRAWLRLGVADGERRAVALLERVGAAGYVAHFPWELSCELRQRVAIARALATAPALVLVDQPTTPPTAAAFPSGPAFPPRPAFPSGPPPLSAPPGPPVPSVPPVGGASLLPPLPALLRGIAADGLAVLVTTDDPAFARAAADRVVFMEGGRIIEQGAPEEFFTTPRTARARDFLSATTQQ